MTGLDYRRAPIALREKLTFTQGQVEELDRRIATAPGVEGCVLLSTCNRTEVYLAGGEGLDPGALLCAAAGVDYETFSHAFVTRTGEDAARHLLDVASGMQSQIWGDDQILTQVKGAVASAREAGTAGAVLETLFRTAASAGKEVKTRVKLTGVPASAAQRAVDLLERNLGGLKGKTALVVGNGEMGRLSARLLRDKGCAVTVTVRTYHRGQTVIPNGCATVSYDDRYAAMEGTDLLISATKSPHCTVTEEQYRQVANPPRVLADLAIPRDIDPAIGGLEGFTLYNMDSLGVSAGDGTDPALIRRAEEVLAHHMDRLRQWMNYRESLPVLEELKAAVEERVLQSPLLDGVPEGEEIVALAVSRTVDLLAGGLKEQLTAETLKACAEKIRANTTGKRRTGREEEHHGGKTSALSAFS